MKILVAPDSFKGSLSSVELCETIREAIENVTAAEVIEVPISDGGEGFLESICSAVDGLQREKVLVRNPLGQRIEAEMAIDVEGKTAFIEMAKCSGLTLVSEEKRNSYESFSYGVGDLILHGLDQGCRTFNIGLGGSATNDAGVGMLMQLGVIFKDKQGEPIDIQSLWDIGQIASLDLQKVDPRLFKCQFILATDVNNPLCGEEGATFVFGPQKGLPKESLKSVDDLLKHYGKVLEKHCQKSLLKLPGTGAAGGIPTSFLALFDTKMRQGIDIILEYLELEQLLPSVDFVITGEGKLDAQTFSGKVIKGICQFVQPYHIPVIAICGNIELSRKEIKELGLNAAFSICKGPSSLDEAMKNSKFLVSEITENIIELARLNA